MSGGGRVRSSTPVSLALGPWLFLWTRFLTFVERVSPLDELNVSVEGWSDNNTSLWQPLEPAVGSSRGRFLVDRALEGWVKVHRPCPLICTLSMFAGSTSPTRTLPSPEVLHERERDRFLDKREVEDDEDADGVGDAS